MNSLLNRKKSELKGKKKKGFTLIELIIVIAIIAILIALAIPKFGEIVENSNQKADQAAAKNIASIVAQEIANGNDAIIKTTGTKTAVGKDDAIGGKLDGNKVPKARAANKATAFNYLITTKGNIEVYYGDSNDEVYPEYKSGEAKSNTPAGSGTGTGTGTGSGSGTVDPGNS